MGIGKVSRCWVRTWVRTWVRMWGRKWVRMWVRMWERHRHGQESGRWGRHRRGHSCGQGDWEVSEHPGENVGIGEVSGCWGRTQVMTWVRTQVRMQMRTRERCGNIQMSGRLPGHASSPKREPLALRALAKLCQERVSNSTK